MNFQLRISPQGLALVEHFEDCWLTARPDEAGVPTIGWGETSAEGHLKVINGMTITQAEADSLLLDSLATHEGRVKQLVTVDLSQPQFDALVSFDFNTGGLMMESGPSTLLKQLNANQPFMAAGEFGEWIHGGGKVLNGLVRRRNAERDLFCGFGWERWKS